MASYYDDPNSTGFNSGAAQLGRAVQRKREDAEVIANPVGPPALVRAPTPASAAAPQPAARTPQMGALERMQFGQDAILGPTKPYASFRPFDNPQRTPVIVNPTPTQLAQDGALRPAIGPWSASNPQPMTDAAGNLLPARPTPSSVAAVPASGGSSLTNAAAASAPLIAGATAANAGSSASLSRPSFAGVRGGAATTAPQATSINGRPLGYGAMVNGVRTFSDGSGGAGAPPATMTRPQIDALANGNRLTIADAGVGGNIQSEAFGLTRPVAGGAAATRVLAGTPELGSAEGLALSRPASADQQGGVFHMPSRSDMAMSDLASILNRDTRSTLGRAMRNADVEARSISSDPDVRAGLQAQAQKTLTGQVSEGLRAGTDEANAAARESGETGRARLDATTRLATTNANNSAELQRALINRPTPTQVNLADGSLGLLGPDGVVRPALGADGMPVRPQLTRQQVDQGAYQKLLSENVNRLLQIDPLTGKKADGAAPTPEELLGATRAASALTDVAFGGARGQGEPPAAPTSGAPSAEASAYLRQNPQYRQQFDQKYGPGAAARVLGVGA